MIRKLLQDALFSKEEWSGYNPEGFAYLYTYEDYEDSTAWYSWPEYFVNSYGTTGWDEVLPWEQYGNLELQNSYLE